MAKFCKKCGTQLKEGAKFCPNCGAAVTSAAPAKKSGKKKYVLIAVAAVAVIGVAIALFGGGDGGGGGTGGGGGGTTTINPPPTVTPEEFVEPTPEVSPGELTIGPASGTLSTGVASIRFADGGEGQAALLPTAQEDIPSTALYCYDLVLDENASTAMTLSMEVPEPAEGFETRLSLGLPCVDDEGEEGFFFVPLETTRSGNTISAEMDWADYADAVEDIVFFGYNGLRENSMSRRNIVAQEIKAMGGYISTYYFAETVYHVPSPEGTFQFDIPESRMNFFSDPRSGKLRVEDASGIGRDLEAILKTYRDTFVHTSRRSYPIHVEMIPAQYKNLNGGYGGGVTKNGCVLYLNFDLLRAGYGSDEGSKAMYHTLVHEMQHFIQWEYTNEKLRATWFDEAAAVYYEMKIGDQSGHKEAVSSNLYTKNDSKGNPLAMRQYDGMTPSATALVSKGAARSDGYARRPLIEYLIKNYGEDFLEKFYKEYEVYSSGVPVEELLVQKTGKSMGELTRGFYDSLIGKGELTSLYTNPWEIYLNHNGDNLAYYTNSGILTESNPNGLSMETVSFPLSRYGAHFIKIDPKNVPASRDSMSITLDTPGTSAILFAIRGDSYAQITTYRSWEKKLEDIPLIAQSYLLLVINESDVHYGGGMLYDEASVSVNFHHMNDGKKGSFPTSAAQLPEQYSGVLSVREIELDAYNNIIYDYADMPVDVTLTFNYNQSAPEKSTIHVEFELGEANGTFYTVPGFTVPYDSSTGGGSNEDGSVWFEKGDYGSGEDYDIRIFAYYPTGVLFASFTAQGAALDQRATYRLEKVTQGGDVGYEDVFRAALKNANLNVLSDGSFTAIGEAHDILSVKGEGGGTVEASVTIEGQMDPSSGGGTYHLQGSVIFDEAVTTRSVSETKTQKWVNTESTIRTITYNISGSGNLVPTSDGGLTVILNHTVRMQGSGKYIKDLQITDPETGKELSHDHKETPIMIGTGTGNNSWDAVWQLTYRKS